jgi:hypothetical protein
MGWWAVREGCPWCPPCTMSMSKLQQQQLENGGGSTHEGVKDAIDA